MYILLRTNFPDKLRFPLFYNYTMTGCERAPEEPRDNEENYEAQGRRTHLHAVQIKYTVCVLPVAREYILYFQQFLLLKYVHVLS